MDEAIRNLRDSLERVRGITFDIDGQTPKALADRALADRLETMRCALVVILTGYFENFLRDATRSFIANVNSRGIPYRSLPDELRATNLRDGGLALTQRVKEESGGRRTWISASSSDIANRLGSIASATHCELVWEAFAQTRSNPSFKVVTDFLTRFGVEAPAVSLEAAAGVSHQLMSTTLESLLQMRNESAHAGQPSIVPTPSEIRSFCDMIERISQGLTTLLCSHLLKPVFAPQIIRL